MVADPLGYYARLGLAPTATAAEVKVAFRAKARLLHPDVPGTGDARAFQRLNEAYRVLSQPHLRANYDRSGAILSFAPVDLRAAPAIQPAGWPAAQARRGPRIALGGLSALAALGIAAGLYLAIQAPVPDEHAFSEGTSIAAAPVTPTPHGMPRLAGEPSHYVLPGGGPAPVWVGDPGNGALRRIGELPAFTQVHATALVTEGLQGINLADGSLAYVDASRLMPGDAAEAERARCSYVAGPPPRSGEVLARDAAGDGRVLVVNHAPNPAVVTLRTADGRLAARVFLNGGAQTELSGLPTQKLVESAAFGELWSRGCDRFLAGARAQLHRTPVNAGSAVAVEPDD